MRKIITLAVTAASAAALMGTAVSAQPYDGRSGRHESSSPHRGEMGYSQRLNRLERAIDRGARRGDLTRAEIHAVRGLYNLAAHRVEMYRPNGYSGREAADINRRIKNLEWRLRAELRDDDYARRDRYDYRR